MVSLGELCSPRQWGALSQREMTDSGNPVYGANGVIGYSDKFTHVEPTILVGCRGSIGKVHVTQGRSYATGNAMALDDLKLDRVSLRYLAAFLSWRTFDDVVTGSSQPQLTRAGILRIKVPLPPLDEQNMIAAILDRAAAFQAVNRQQLSHVDCLLDSYFQACFGDPTRPSLSAPVGVLEDWVDPDRPITYGILKPGPDIPNGVPYVRVADMKNRGINVSTVRHTTPEIAGEYARSTIQSGDLLMSIRGHVGRFALVPESLHGGNITQDSARIAVRDPDSAIFVRAAMESPSIQRWMAQRTKGAAVRGINLGDLRQVPIAKPGAEEVAKFAQVVRCAEELRAKLRRRVEWSDESTASLLSRAFGSQVSSE
jgi:type I restriction enzyme S subunit